MNRPLILLLTLTVAACGGDKNDEDAATNTPEQRDSVKNAEREPVFPENQAIGVLHAISDAEIAMARVARDVSQNEVVLAYSRVLAADYQGIKELLTAPAADNQLSSAIRSAGDSIARELGSMSGGFNNTFIEEQVKAHKQALAVLDTAIIPSVRDSAVRTLIQQIRPAMAAHLQRALQILAARRTEARERGDEWVSGFQQRRDSAVFAPSIRTEPAAPMTAPQPMPLPRAVPDTTTPPATTSNQ